MKTNSYWYNPEIEFTRDDFLYLESVRVTNKLCPSCKQLTLVKIHNNPKQLCELCLNNNIE